MHTYDFHIGDYARDTLHLSLIEHGIYRLLLDRAYADETPLFSEPETLARKIGARSEKEKKAVETVLNEFFQKTPEGWTHKRVIEELGLAKDRTLKAKYSQLCRWWDKNKWDNKPTLTDYLANPEAYHDETTGHIRQPYETDTTVSKRNTLLPPSAFRLPPSANNTPIVPKGTDRADSPDPSTDSFDLTESIPTEKKERSGAAHERLAEQIYQLYPRKVGKDDAIRVIQRLLKKGKVPPEDLIVTVRNYAKATATWTEHDRQFIPYPSAWFNKGRYNDDPREWLRGPSDENPTPETYLPSTYDGPEGWRDIMTELYGSDDWQSAYPNWQATTPGDREKIKARLLQSNT